MFRRACVFMAAAFSLSTAVAEISPDEMLPGQLTTLRDGYVSQIKAEGFTMRWSTVQTVLPQRTGD
jgi:hypothetical protein